MCWKWGKELVNFKSVCHITGSLLQKLIYSFNKYLVIAYYVAGISLGVRDKTDKKNSCFHELRFL